MLQITINGEPREVPDGLTIEGLIRYLSLAPERLAVERNRQVIRRTDWDATTLEVNDQLEIIHFVGGGEQEVTG